MTDACVAAQGVAACMAALLTSIDPATGQVLPHAAADAAPGEAPAATAKVRKRSTWGESAKEGRGGPPGKRCLRAARSRLAKAWAGA